MHATLTPTNLTIIKFVKFESQLVLYSDACYPNPSYLNNFLEADLNIFGFLSIFYFAYVSKHISFYN